MGAIAITVLVTVAGAMLRRTMGGWNVMPNWLEIPCHTLLLFVILTYSGWFKATWYHAAIAIVLIIVGVIYWRLGHGSYHDMGTGPLKDDETFAWLNRLLVPQKKHYTILYDFVGMAIRYTVPALPFFFVSYTFPPAVGVLIALGYLLAWERMDLFPHEKMEDDDCHAPFWNGPTATGEVISGGLFYGLLSACMFLGV